MKATEQQLQEIYEEAVSAEIADQNGVEMAYFDLLCKLDEVGGMATFIRNLIDMVRNRGPELTVWYGDMPETNGKTNWTAMLHRKGQHPWEGITIDRSEYPDRVRYEADRMRHLIGELDDEPDILTYDADAHSGYVAPQQNSPDREMLKRLAVILSGSDAPGEIRSLTVTAQSFVDRCKTLAKERDALQLAGGQPQRDMPLSARANGEANSYTLLRDGNWFTNILMNGEMTVPQQWEFLNTIAKKQ